MRLHAQVQPGTSHDTLPSRQHVGSSRRTCGGHLCPASALSRDRWTRRCPLKAMSVGGHPGRSEYAPDTHEMSQNISGECLLEPTRPFALVFLRFAVHLISTTHRDDQSEDNRVNFRRANNGICSSFPCNISPTCVGVRSRADRASRHGQGLPYRSWPQASLLDMHPERTLGSNTHELEV